MKLLRRIKRLVFSRRKPTGVRYWRKRARDFGKRSVFNVQHGEDELEGVTRMQTDTLFPLLQERLTGEERLIVDFGCGPGRFTAGLAELIKGQAIGVEPVKDLIDLAPKADNTRYLYMKEGKIPLDCGVADVVWICIVLGGIVDENLLLRTIREIDRILKPGGLVFLIENTTVQPDQWHWKYRSVEVYGRLFSFIDLKYLSDYEDLGEKISVMAGRKVLV